MCATHGKEFWNTIPITCCGTIKKSWNTKEVEFDPGIAVCSSESDIAYIYLHESDGQDRVYLPIACGVFEASAIANKLRKIPFPRPLTHDAMRSVIQSLGATLRSVVIDSLDSEKSCYYAKLRIADRLDTECLVDVRPSDAIALALAADAPIYVASSVLQRADGYGYRYG